MVDLNGHAAGNGGYSQGTPTARRAFLYSEIAHRRIVAGWEILRNHMGEITIRQAQVQPGTAELKRDLFSRVLG